MDEPKPPSRASGVPALLRGRGARTAADIVAFSMLAAAAAGLAVFGARREIARQYAEGWLAERGIESAFVIEAFDAGAFVGSVRLGPEADPVFAAERVEVAYDFTPPWSGAPFKLNTRAIRVVRPRIKAAFDGQRFSAGPLDPLIEDFLKRPDTGEPGPAVLIEGASATIVTPAGPLRLLGEAAIDDGELLRLDAALLPSRLRGEDFTAASEGGRVRLRKAGGTLSVSSRLDLDYQRGEVELTGGDLALEGAVPYPRDGGLAGTAALRAALRADRLAFSGGGAEAVEANLRLTGQASGQLSAPALAGDLAGSGRAGVLEAGGTSARDLQASFDLRRFALDRQGARGAGGYGLRTGALADGTIHAALAQGAVSFETKDEGLTLIADADLTAKGAMGAERARRIARDIPLASADPEQAAAMAAALRDFTVHAPRLRLAVTGGPAVLALGAPAVAASASGGRASVSPRGGALFEAGRGSFDLAVSGGGLPRIEAQVAAYAIGHGGLDADLAVRAELDAPPVQGARLDLAGRLMSGGGRTSFVLSRCGTAAAEKVEFGDNDPAQLTGRLCPAGDPLVRAGGAGWRTAARFEALSAKVPSLGLAASDAAGSFAMSGAGGPDAAQVRIERARIADLEARPRFHPLRASGQLALSGEVWRGRFPVSAAGGAPLGELALFHDGEAGRGRLDVAAPQITFKSPGLQPADLSPLGAAMRNADGAAAFAGAFAWGPEGAVSGGTLSVPRLTFASPAGTVTNLSTTLAFTSLAPLVTAPGQPLTIERVNAVVPLNDVEGRFSMEADALRIEALAATAAKGRVSLEPTVVSLKPDAAFQGVMVLDGVDLGHLVATSTLAEKVRVEAVVNGRLPFQIGPAGLRFENGRIAAAGPGRISIDRAALTEVSTDAAPPSPMDGAEPQEVNAIEDFAYQAMENLSFDTLEAGVNSVPGGRLSMLFRVKGRHDPEVAEPARVGVAELISGRAFRRRIPLPKGTPVDLTLDTSLNFDELLAAWRAQWRASD